MSYSTQNLESVKAVARGFTNKTTNQNPNFNRKIDYEETVLYKDVFHIIISNKMTSPQNSLCQKFLEFIHNNYGPYRAKRHIHFKIYSIYNMFI